MRIWLKLQSTTMAPQLSPVDIYQNKISLGELSPDGSQRQAVAHLNSLYEQIISGASNKKWHHRLLGSKDQSLIGLYLWGGVGTGKTVLMDLFFQSLPAGLGSRIHFHRFMQMVHDKNKLIKNKQDPLRIIASSFAENAKVLCLDEFTVSDITDAMILSRLLDQLFKLDVVLVTTSNTQIENLYPNGLQRGKFMPAIELLKKHTQAINIDAGTDYRMAFLKSDKIFHSPLDLTSQQSLTNCFRQLSGNTDFTQTSVLINDREIDAVAVGSGIVWFEFASLCQTNRSNMDYIEIARQFHTVILSNIPQLDHSMDDSARRLIELVDELYDRNVNLIVSAEVAPEDLYKGKRLVEPFKRTTSRLTEMSAGEYLGKPHLP